MSTAGLGSERPGGGARLDVHGVVRRGGFELDARVAAGPGDAVAVMGPSGAGKSTLLAVVAGLLRSREGHVRVDGRDVSSPTTQVPPKHRGVVLLGQDPHLFPHLSARENVVFGLRARRRASSAALRAAADAWLDRVGLGAHRARRPDALSGGQRQRVALARALATAPRLLLLDEPFGALDPATATEIRGVLADQLAATGTTTVFVTHAVVDALVLADRLLLLEEGRVVQDGPPRDVLTLPATPFAAGLAGVARVPGTVRAGVWRAAGLALPAAELPDTDAVAFVPAEAVHLVADAAASASGRLAVWRARVVRVDATVAGARVQTADPIVSVDVPVTALAEHLPRAGDELTLAVDPRAVRIQADPG
ncbi:MULTISPECIES: sulfate/molybdate ABC transporter ATP-binding protein [unclassified Microbacterium]|uniref:sulfate/molybdate ABC transporter ATP-binding protein n=1 Tax=unclassified Microbacterium TaxID=2609290 RepID=UPI003018DE44